MKSLLLIRQKESSLPARRFREPSEPVKYIKTPVTEKSFSSLRPKKQPKKHTKESWPVTETRAVM